MVMLVTLDDVKLHSRVSHDVEDDDLVRKIEAASDLVLQYVTAPDFVDSTGEVIAELMPPRVHAATLMTFDWLYNERGGSGESANPDMNYLPRAILALLYSLRDPTIA